MNRREPNPAPQPEGSKPGEKTPAADTSPRPQFSAGDKAALHGITPMEAVAALYSDGHGELSEAIIASLSRAVFKEGPGAAAGWARRFMARVSY